MLWIGLTGGIASGKSTVANLLIKKGYSVVDADQIAHQCLDQGTESYQKIVLEFGKIILDEDKKISRLKLGQIVFQNKELLQKLENIIHPEVQKRVLLKKQEFEQQGQSFAFYDVPLLFEKNLQAQFDKVVVVYCPPEQQLQRLLKRNNLSIEDAKLRIASQIPIDQKKSQADFVIENSGSLIELDQKVEQLIQQLR